MQSNKILNTISQIKKYQLKTLFRKQWRGNIYMEGVKSYITLDIKWVLTAMNLFQPSITYPQSCGMYRVGQKTGPRVEVYKFCTWWCRKAFHTSVCCSLLVRSKTNILNVTTFKCSLHKFRETTLHCDVFCFNNLYFLSYDITAV